MKALVFVFLLLSLSYGLNRERINSQALSQIDFMVRLENFPQRIPSTKLLEWIYFDWPPKEDWLIDGKSISDYKNAIELNFNKEGLSPEVQVSYGWTIRRTNMRMYPTSKTIHAKGKDLDYNQYTLLEPFTMLAILHQSKDGQWLYVHAPYMRGWVASKDVRQSTKEELIKLSSMPKAVVKVKSINVDGITFGLGSKLPIVQSSKSEILVMLPNGNLKSLPRSLLAEGFEDFSEEKAREILESMLGTPYDWGGKNGRWDCSSLVQSLYWVFGLELPRNSSQQAKVGRVIATKFSSYEEMKSVLEKSPPFRTLLFMKGHVMIFGGLENKEPVLYHSVGSLRYDDGTLIRAGAIVKNRLETERLTNIYRKIISVNILE
ncbi:MAG: SH3 domain-containing protein [Aquificaceae bacterium]|nr:SH3 domain-containing protein [Aquificaceae bacterium]MDW8237240.1 SH3 domain-containing protein [Aquificaceae bacterium]